MRIECWGDYACFTRPELKTERYSYDVITPSAARGLLEAIYWHPGLEYVIDRIFLMSPIKFTRIKRNEVKIKLPASKELKKIQNGHLPYISTRKERSQRSSTILKDVRYVIDFHFNMTKAASERDNPIKFCSIILKRARKGQCFHQPYLGCREFPANVRLVDEDEEISAYPETRPLGLMLYDMDFANAKKSADGKVKPMFFMAELKDGVMDLRDCEVFK